MSKDSTPVGPAQFDYIAAHTEPEGEYLSRLRRAASDAGLPVIHIAPEQAALLQILLRLGRARDVVEVGTLGGYSAIAMARALPADGKVRTLELAPQHAEFARQWIARSDVADRIEVLVGDAHELLPTLADASADAVFLDADKTGYVDYLRQAMRILRPGGLLLADNVLAGGDVALPAVNGTTATAMRAFNEAVVATPGLRAIIVPIGDGCTVGVKDR